MAIVVLFMLIPTEGFLLPFAQPMFTYVTVTNASFTFGKHFPEITQPLDNSFEVTHDSASLASGKSHSC
jgi:hypothetical protein